MPLAHTATAMPRRLAHHWVVSAISGAKVAEQYARGSALNMAATLEIDAVIDPAETRDWLVRGLQGARRNAQMGAPTWPA